MEDGEDLDGIVDDEDNEETNQLKTVCSLASEVTNGLHSTLKTIETAADASWEPLLTAAEKTSEEFDFLIPSIIESRNESSEYYAKWQSAEIQRERDQAEIKRLKGQILIQTNYCTNIGGVLGNLVWRASCDPEMVHNWLSERRSLKKLGEILTITDRTTVGFFKTYEDVLPPTHRDEYEFLMGLLGTVSNVAASPEGRQFLIDNEDGRSLVKNLVTYMPRIPIDSSAALKKLILIILWNMSVNKDGLRYLFEVKISQVVLRCLDDRGTVQIQALGLQLLQSITHNLTEARLLNDLLEWVPTEAIRRLANAGHDEKVARIARDVVDVLTNIEK